MVKQRIAEIALLFFLLLGAFLVRLYKIDSPIADWHSWRQADTAAVSRNFIKYGFNLWLPRYDDISSIQSGKYNPNGYRLVEFPIYNTIVAVLYSLFGVHESYARLVSALSSLASLVCIYVLVKSRLGSSTAFFAALLFAFLPYNIYFSRAIFPENMALAFSLLSLTVMDFWARFKRYELALLILAAILASLALLTKLTAVFVLLPLGYLAWHHKGFGLVRSLSMWIAFLIVIVPIALWRIWVSQFPEGVPANAWLLNGGEIRFKGAWFRWIFSERLGRLILTVGNVPLFVLGLAQKIRPKEGWLFVWMIISSLLYVTVFARGNIQHDYYQILIIPSLVIFVAKGISWLISSSSGLSKLATPLLVVVLLLMAFAFGWYEIRGDYNINHPEIVAAGKDVDALVPPSAKVIAPYDGDTAFLYQTNRAGWPTLDEPIEKLREKGATVFVSVRFDDETKRLATQYATLKRTEQYVIYDLSHPL